MIGVQPISQYGGFDRGLPAHRYYVQQFLQEFSPCIHGHCLEFHENLYTSRYGGSRVAKIDILSKEDDNPRATIVADLTKVPNIPSNLFDCIICTHALHMILEVDKAISELYRILKPRGVLLVAVPTIGRAYAECHEKWRFTPEGLQLLLARVFGDENVLVRAYGNSLTAAGTLRGLVAHEFTREELNYHDLRFTMETCAKATKQSSLN
jgi:SAM-dependent methyltransferase